MISPARIIFFGSSEISANILSALIAEPSLEIAAVVTKPAPAHGHTSSQDTPVARLAQEHELTLFRPHTARDILADVQALQPTLGVLFAYGQILPAELLAAFPLGIVNIHPSLLPRHRGPSPIESAILAGDSDVGTSLMILEEKMDTGPILAQKSWSADQHISKAQLTQDLVAASLELLIPTINAYVAGGITPHAQDETLATYCQLISKNDGIVDPTNETATSLSRKVRAYADWPSVTLPIRLKESTTTLKLHAVTIIDAETTHDSPRIIDLDKALSIELPRGTVRIDQAQLPGRSIVSGGDLRNGPHIQLA